MTKDLTQARELAEKLGYIPRRSDTAAQLTARYQAHYLRQGHTLAEAKSKAEFWANLKANPPAGMTVIDPDLSVDDLLMQYRMERGGIDPNSITAASDVRVTAAAGGGPLAVYEQPPSRIFPIANGIQLNRYSDNPGREFYTQFLAGSTLVGSAPEMFGAGPLPPFTASGIDPAQLRWVPWTHRHTAAVAEARSTVLLLVEAGLQGVLDPEDQQSPDGHALWTDYMQRIAGWVQTQPVDESLASIDQQLERLYGSGESRS
jgi:hypothetical protein